MIKAFRTDEARIKHQSESMSKMKGLNKKWKRSMERMKETKERNYSNVRDKLLEKIEKRRDFTLRQIKDYKEKKQQFLTEIAVKNKDANQALQEKIGHYLKEQENERLYVQGSVNEKLEKFTKKNKENLEEMKKQMEVKMERSLDKFNENYNKVLQYQDQKLRENIEKPIEKFENWVIK